MSSPPIILPLTREAQLRLDQAKTSIIALHTRARYPAQTGRVQSLESINIYKEALPTIDSAIATAVDEITDLHGIASSIKGDVSSIVSRLAEVEAGLKENNARLAAIEAHIKR